MSNDSKSSRRTMQGWNRQAKLGFWMVTLGMVALLPWVVRSVQLSSLVVPLASPTVSQPVAALATPDHQVYDLPTSQVHTLKIPPGSYTVTPAMVPDTADLHTFAQQQDAIAVLNGGFFDPQNQQSTSYIIQGGQVVGDPTQNERLMQNPDLTPYLEKILNRSEFRRYRCGQMNRYDIAPRRQPVPDGCQLLDALGAGPQLLPELTLEAEGFTAAASNGTVIRDALGSTQPNARTAIGLLPDGSMLWVMAAQIPETSPSGLSLPELASFLKAQGAITALNLDGGSSSALFYQGKTTHGKLDAQGNPILRPVKSVLLLKPGQN